MMSGLPGGRWRIFFLIVTAYLVTGEPALLLAEFSGYAAPIFPPAGIAVVFCFAIGFEILPAIFVGAFLLNFWIGFSKTYHFGPVEIASGLCLAIASTLQAGIGGWALRRYVGYPAPLDKLADIARFLVIIPLVCLTSASLSTLSLHWLGTLDASEARTVWGAWWLGDTLGVLMVFPLVMTAFGEPRDLWKKRALTVVLPMSAAFVLFVLVFLQTSRWEKGEALSEFRLESQKATEVIHARLNARAALVEAVRALMTGTDEISQSEFSRFSKDILSRYPTIQALAWAPSTSPQYPVVLLEPPAADGFPNLDSNLQWQEALLKAMSTGQLVATAPTGKNDQVLLMLRVRGRYQGVVFAILNMGELLTKVVNPQNGALYARLADLDSGLSLYDTFPHNAKALSRSNFEFGGRKYAFETAPTAAYLRNHQTWESWSVLAGGIFATGILGAFLLLGTGYAARIEREVKERTDELRQSEFRYQQMFEESAAVKLALDPENGKIVDANKAAEEFYGYPRSQLLSMKITDINTRPWAEISAEIEKAANEKLLCFNFKHRLASGEIRDVEIYSGPVDLGGKTILYAIVHDITDRKRSEESLRRFTSIFEASSEAVMVVDSNNRIVAINPAFSDITGYALHEVEGKNPRILASGQHDDSFYREMWRSLETYGYWQGEIWDKRKNGDVFPEWLTINTIYDEQGNVRERVALFSDITKKKEAEEQVWRQANFDDLTGLPNRSMFRDRLDFEIRKAARNGFAFALLFIDLDRFKEVNDTLGHEAGDRLLVEAAQRIASSVRESDTVARLGGDEFTVILSDLPGNAHVENMATTIIQKLAEPFHLGKERAYVSGSIGITLYPSDAEQSSELLKNADQAMYVAKGLGKNRFAYFTPELQEAALERMKLTGELRTALPNGELQLAFQPIVAIETNAIVKAEALLRWTNPRRGAVSPTEFIPLAEETGLIHEIGDWVFREAARWAKRWQNLRENFQVSLNVSPVQLMVQSGGHSWPDHLRELGLSGRSIVVEITEGVLLNASEAVAERLAHLRNAGIQIAIDDFGTGYSALGYLKKFDIDYLKIDRSFISGIETDSDDLALSMAIVAMAHSLSMEVVAEGVETQGQQAILPSIRCDYAQGYLYARPLSPDEFERLLG